MVTLWEHFRRLPSDSTKPILEAYHEFAVVREALCSDIEKEFAKEGSHLNQRSVAHLTTFKQTLVSKTKTYAEGLYVYDEVKSGILRQWATEMEEDPYFFESVYNTFRTLVNREIQAVAEHPGGYTGSADSLPLMLDSLVYKKMQTEKYFHLRQLEGTDRMCEKFCSALKEAHQLLYQTHLKKLQWSLCNYSEEAINEISTHLKLIFKMVEWAEQRFVEMKNVEGFAMNMENRCEMLRGLKTRILRSGICVRVQGPKVLKTTNQTKIVVVALLPVYEEGNVEAILINQDGAKQLWKEELDASAVKSCQERVTRNVVKVKRRVTRETKVEVFEADFTKLTVSSGVQRSPKNGRALQELYCFLFRISVRNVMSWCCSAPFPVSLHTWQNVEGLGNLFWYKAFQKDGGVPLEFVEEVLITDLIYALNKYFNTETGTSRDFTEENIRFLKKEILGIPKYGQNPSESQVVQRKDFCRSASGSEDSSKGTSKKFEKKVSPTFWDWFYATMEIVRSELKDLWEKRLIVGFFNREDYEHTGIVFGTQTPGTLMIRFSRTKPGALHIPIFYRMQNAKPVFNNSPPVCGDALKNGKLATDMMTIWRNRHATQILHYDENNKFVTTDITEVFRSRIVQQVHHGYPDEDPVLSVAGSVDAPHTVGEVSVNSPASQMVPQLGSLSSDVVLYSPSPTVLPTGYSSPVELIPSQANIYGAEAISDYSWDTDPILEEILSQFSISPESIV